MSNIPAYLNPCIAPDTSSSNSVYVLGVPSSADGRLEAYKVSLSNVNVPSATFFANYTEVGTWSSTAPKYCTNYADDPATSPIVVQQFGPRSFLTQMHPNGSFEWSANFNEVAFESPKLYSLNAANGNFNWFTAMTNSTNLVSGSPWVGVRVNDTKLVYSVRDFLLGQYPTSTPLLSVGSYASAARPPIVGFLSVFDGDGKTGTVYTASSSASEIGGIDRAQTLSNPQAIDMGGAVLSKDAYSVTQGSTGYVVDKGSDGSTVLYKISPGNGSLKLTAVTPTMVPPFWPNRAATSLGSQLVFFGGISGNAPTSTFHIYDSVSNQWLGPGLVQSKTPSTGGGNGGNGGNNGGNNNSGSSDSKSNTGAIIGGIVGGLVVLALLAFFVIRHNRNKKKAREEEAVTPTTPHMQHVAPPAPYPDGTKVPPEHMVHPPYTGAPQHMPGPLPSPPTDYNQFGMTAISSPPQPAHTEQPIIFQAPYPPNPHHSYQPPILTSVEQPHQPSQFFQPAAAATSAATSPVPSNTAYSPIHYTAASTPHSQAAGTTSSGSPQYVQPHGHGYAS